MTSADPGAPPSPPPSPSRPAPASGPPAGGDRRGATANAPRAGARPQRGDELELTIDGLAYGGEGVARLGEEGYVVFVTGAVPGDRVRAVVHKRKRTYAHARAVEVLQPSPERVPPRAQHPGVPWQVLPYERQLEIKRAQVHEALTRLGGLDGFELEAIVPATEQWRYRNKVEYSFGTGEGGELVCGFHAPAGWNRVVAIDDCLLVSERANRAREAALRWCRAQGLRPWERSVAERGVGRRSAAGRSAAGRSVAERSVAERGAGGAGGARGGVRDVAARTGPAPDGRARVRNLVVREGRHTGKLQVRLVSTPGELDAGALAQALKDALGERTLSGVLWTRSERLAETTGGGDTELVWGEERLPERLGELDLEISPEAFFQTNTEMAGLLYGVAREYAALQGWERVFDLYCGIGTIALTLAPHAGELWGIDLVPEAIADAIASARRNGVAAHFFAGDVRLALPELVARSGRPDVIVVDPPRAGLSGKVVRGIARARPRRVVYISCNPTTLAPNAAQLAEEGWRLTRVRPVDMFPHTHHIECVALFERAGVGPL